MNNNQQLQQLGILKQRASYFVKQHEQQSTTSTTWNFKNNVRRILSNNMNNNQQLQQLGILKQRALDFVKQHEQQSTTSTT